MLKKMVVIGVLCAASTLAVAGESEARDVATTVIPLQDGSTVFVFNGGKMGVESKYGEVLSIKPGTTLIAKDGRTITMVGNEVMRLEELLQQGYAG